MRTMIELGNRQIIDTPTSIDCGRDVRLRRSFRTLVDSILPACCSFPDTTTLPTDHDTSTTVTGTIFGHRTGRVSFCIQEDHTRGGPPLLLLEFAVPTSFLAHEMRHGLLRIALESDRRHYGGAALYDVPVWRMCCNGRKVGFAVRRRMTAVHASVLKLMGAVSVGAGVLPVEEDDGDLMYLRASFDRVVGSVDSESFHMRNPVGSSGQELSVFLLRS